MPSRQPVLSPSSPPLMVPRKQISVGNVGGIIATFLFVASDAPQYTTGYSVAIGFTALTIVSTTAYMLGIRRENALRKIGRAGVDLDDERRRGRGRQGKDVQVYFVTDPAGGERDVCSFVRLFVRLSVVLLCHDTFSILFVSSIFLSSGGKVSRRDEDEETDLRPANPAGRWQASQRNCDLSCYV